VSLRTRRPAREEENEKVLSSPEDADEDAQARLNFDLSEKRRKDQRAADRLEKIEFVEHLEQLLFRSRADVCSYVQVSKSVYRERWQ
jgi:hypothetical protein